MKIHLEYSAKMTIRRGSFAEVQSYITYKSKLHIPYFDIITYENITSS